MSTEAHLQWLDNRPPQRCRTLWATARTRHKGNENWQYLLVGLRLYSAPVAWSLHLPVFPLSRILTLSLSVLSVSSIRPHMQMQAKQQQICVAD